MASVGRPAAVRNCTKTLALATNMVSVGHRFVSLKNLFSYDLGIIAPWGRLCFHRVWRIACFVGPLAPHASTAMKADVEHVWKTLLKGGPAPSEAQSALLWLLGRDIACQAVP